jgi:hypothetical protein
VTVCPGYLFAFATNLHNFRDRSLVERFLWSMPISLAVSTILSIIIGKFLSLDAVVVFLWVCLVLSATALVNEWLRRRRLGQKWKIGWNPLGGKALVLAIAWTALTTLSLIDIQTDRKLFMSLAMFDHASRVNWTEAVLRTGVPPSNPLYWYRHASGMRYYYFWNVVCAAVARMTRIEVRSVFLASCAWVGLAFAGLMGLFLKHFLEVGNQLRRQFLAASTLLAVSGIGTFCNLLYFLRILPSNIDGPAENQIPSWVISFLFVPHHVASMLCCMLAFLLAWLAQRESPKHWISSGVLIALALASSFGLSVYVAAAFFVIVLAWSLWQVVVARALLPVAILAAGGVGAVLLLLPYLRELTHTDSKLQGGSIFAFTVREMIPPDWLLATHPFKSLTADHPSVAVNVARSLLLLPGYSIELGFYFVVLLVCVTPLLRRRKTLSPAHRSLVFVVLATLPLISFLRSGVLKINDFGVRAALPMQFSLLLLASEMLMPWRKNSGEAVDLDFSSNPFVCVPAWVRSIAAVTLLLGVLGSIYQTCMLRFLVPLVDSAKQRAASTDRGQGDLAHDAYISAVGYTQLKSLISSTSLVQFNPAVQSDELWRSVDLAWIDHQVAIVSDAPWCGSELGGDPAPCPSMAATIDRLYKQATAQDARGTCGQLGIQYLVARIFDPIWTDKKSWVWTLPPVVADDEFRVLDCRQ